MPAHGICWKIPQCVPTIATGNSPHLHRDSLRVSTSPIIHYEEDSPFPSLLEHDHLYTFYPGQLLQQAQTLVAINKPPMRDQLSLRNYIENRRCLVEGESAFAYHKEDLVTLRPGRDHSFVDAFVERMLRTFHCRPLQVLLRTSSKLIDTVADRCRQFSVQR